jgi:peptidyl-prolyl cis-trans isomerase D
MFDLFRSRDKAVRILLGALLVLVALSMLTYLVPGGYSTGSSGRDEVLATIGDEKVTIRDVQLQLSRQMKNRSFPPEMAEFMVPQLIDRMISDRALAYEAARLGLQVSDTDLAQAIESIMPQAFDGGKFNKEMYQAFLTQQNMNIPEFEADVRKSMLSTRLMNLALEGIVVTPQEVEREYHRKNDKVSIEYIGFSPAQFKAKVTTTPNELQAFYRSQVTNFTVPEKRGFEALVFDQARLGASLTVPDAAIQAYYATNQDRFRTPERVKVRHILVKTTDKTPDEVKKLEAKAQDLLKQLKGGADFGELAKKNSDDPGSAAKGGDLDWVARGQTVPSFEQTAFALKPNELSNVVKTEYGFHIIQVQQHEAARLQPLSEAKAEIEADVKRQQLADRLPQLAEQAHAEIIKAPGSAAQIAEKLGGQAVKVEAAGADDPIPEIGVSKEFSQAVMGTAKGGVTPVVAIGQDKLAFAVVTNVMPQRQATFAEAEARIRDSFVQARSTKLAQDAAKEAANRLAAGQDIRVVAKSYGLEVKKSGEFGRDGAAEGLGSAEYLKEAFDKPVGGTFGPVTMPDNSAVCKVVDKKVAEAGRLQAERADLVLAIKRKKSSERSELFQDGILYRLMEAKKVTKNDEAIKRLVASYRNQV